MTYLKQNILALVALVISVFVLFSGGTTIDREGLGAVGDITNLTNLTVEEDLIVLDAFTPSGASLLASTTATSFKIGQVGTQRTLVLASTCNATASGATVAATSTGFMQCTVTNAVETDNVIAFLATSTLGIANNWVLLGGKSSTTAARVDFKVMNLTGVAAAVPSDILTRVQYQIWR